MTLKEAFIAELDEIAVSDATVDKTIIDQGLTAADTYEGTEAQKKSIDLCMIDVLYRLYTRSDVQEGGFSKSHPDFLRKVEARLLYLARKHNVETVLSVIEKATPTIRNASNRW